MQGSGLLALVGTAAAQQAKQPPAKGAAPAPKAAAQGEPPPAWVKLCEKAQFQKTGADKKPMVGADGKPVIEEKDLCLTHHEQMTPAGVTIVSAAVQQLAGVPEQGMMIMIPAAVGIAIPPGMRVFVYTKDQWAKVQAKEQVDEKALVSQELRFTMCHQNGCTAENQADPKVIQAMQTGAVMAVMAIHVSGRPMSFEVPLNGFDQIYKGPPVDNKLYSEERGKLAQQIRANQLDQMKRLQEQMQNPQAAPGAPAAGGTAPAAKAPPKK